MTRNRFEGTALGAMSLTLLLAFAAGCDDGGEPSDPQEKVSAVRAALESPSGIVDATTVADLNELNAHITATAALFQATGYANMGSDCGSGSITDGSVDLACATQELPEEQRLTGTISFTVEGSIGSGSVEGFAQYTYENVCNATQCVDGVIASEVLIEGESIDSTLAVSFDVKEGSSTTHVFWGAELALDSNSVAAKIAMWDSLDHSYVMESTVSEDGVTFTVTGANGTFSCTANEDGGSCTGDGEINF